AARLREAVLRIVHVRQYAAWTQPEVLAAGPEQVGDPVLDRLRADLEARGGKLPVLEFVTVEGAPDAVLPEMGADAQLLVLGSRGRGG
ncbi:universal stress protein, partial [Streptomyces sp. SID11233]|nr:universal stress protein [Streptomyces sp. SID11233]